MKAIIVIIAVILATLISVWYKKIIDARYMREKMAECHEEAMKKEEQYVKQMEAFEEAFARNEL